MYIWMAEAQQVDILCKFFPPSLNYPHTITVTQFYRRWDGNQDKKQTRAQAINALEWQI